MKSTTRKQLLNLLASLFAAVAAASPAPREATNGAPDLVRRETHAARKRLYEAPDLALSFRNRIEMKLREGSGIRARESRLVVDDAALAAGSPRPDAELALLAAVLNGPDRVLPVRMHTLPEAILTGMKVDGERASGRELADLNLWFYLYVEGLDAAGMADLLNRLNVLDVVEIACPSPLPAPPPGTDPGMLSAAWDEIIRNERAPWPGEEELRAIEKGIVPDALDAQQAEPPVQPAAPGGSADTPMNYEPTQDYGEAAPIGIDVDYLRGLYWGAWGDKSFYTDVEYNWNRSHIDLTDVASSTVYVNGVPSSAVNGSQFVEHGTAVLGMLSSDPNGWGTEGLVPSSLVRLSTEYPTSGPNRPAAVSQAAYQFARGAVIILEMQTTAGFDCNGNGAGDPNDLVPAEWQVAVKDAVRAATANGRIVVAAAGNGGCNLDLAGFGGAFSATDATKDSWSIIVGDGQKATRNASAGSTFGARVDAQGEGDGQLVTCGYGGLYSAEGMNAYYTSTFGGTSGATPSVAGACVALQSILKTYHGSVLDPREIRDLLRRDGTPQGTGGHIGPRPDLRKQVEHLVARHMQIQSADFDGDGRADYAHFRPATGTWYIRYATGATTTIAFGAKGDIPCPANVIGDARAELVVFRPSWGTFTVRRWDGTTFTPASLGHVGDIPVPLDYNGDGRAELAVFRGIGVTTALWRVRLDSGAIVEIPFGQPGDTPLARDLDGNGKDDLLVYRGLPGAGATWYIRYDNGTTSFVPFGMGGDIPLTRRMGGRFHPVVWRPSNGTFYTYNMATGATISDVWGRAGDLPRIADTNGDGEGELIVYRPSTGVFYNLSRGNVTFGQVGDIPMTR